MFGLFFFVKYTATTEIHKYWHTLSLHYSRPICHRVAVGRRTTAGGEGVAVGSAIAGIERARCRGQAQRRRADGDADRGRRRNAAGAAGGVDRKSTRLNTSH